MGGAVRFKEDLFGFFIYMIDTCIVISEVWTRWKFSLDDVSCTSILNFYQLT